MPTRNHVENDTAPTLLEILRAAHADDAAVLGILDRIDRAPELWQAGPAELQGREAVVVGWLLHALHTFREINGERPRSADMRTMKRWAETLDGVGVTPGFIAGQLEVALLVSDAMWAAVKAELAAEGGNEWYGGPEISPDDLHGAFCALREAQALFQRLEEKRQTKLAGLPPIKRRGSPAAQEQFVSRCLSARIKAACGRPCDDFVAKIMGAAFGRPNGLTAERIRDRRRKNARTGIQGKKQAANSL